MKNNLLLGITGSIAASKTEKLYNSLKDQYNIKFVSTSEGLKYLEDNFKKFLEQSSDKKPENVTRPND